MHPNRWEHMPGSHLSLPELFSFTNLVAGVTFLKVILRLPKNVLIWNFWICFAVKSYLSAPAFPTSLPHHCCIAQCCQTICMEDNSANKRDFDPILSLLSYFLFLFSWNFVWLYLTRCGFCLAWWCDSEFFVLLQSKWLFIYLLISGHFLHRLAQINITEYLYWQWWHKSFIDLVNQSDHS